MEARVTDTVVVEKEAGEGRRLAVDVGCRFGIPSAVAAVSPSACRLAEGLARAFARRLAVVGCAPLILPWADREGPEFGAVDEEGRTVLDYAALAAHRVSAEEIAEARRRALGEIRSFQAVGRWPRLLDLLPTARLLLVDDVLSPGLPMEAAVAFARRHGVRRIVVAGATASPAAASWFGRDVDGFVALRVDGGAALERFALPRPRHS
jgi:predicted phosphoribosyltransferase